VPPEPPTDVVPPEPPTPASVTVVEASVVVVSDADCDSFDDSQAANSPDKKIDTAKK
jgi:hypothetical protein